MEHYTKKPGDEKEIPAFGHDSIEMAMRRRIRETIEEVVKQELERINGEFRRRTKTQASLPSQDSVLLLLFVARWTGEAPSVSGLSRYGARREGGVGHITTPADDALNFPPLDRHDPLLVDGKLRTFSQADVRIVKQRPDSLWNRLLIGVAAGDRELFA